MYEHRKSYSHYRDSLRRHCPRVIVCGDPARAEKIASRLDNMTVVAKTREYWTFNGSYKGVPVTVSSHGVERQAPMFPLRG